MSLTLDGTTGISTTGNIVGNNISITGSFAPASLNVSGNVQGGNLLTGGLLSATGNVTGNYLLGNGTFITGLSASKIFNGTSEANIGTSGGNANITIGGTSNVVVVSTAGISVAGTVQASGNITGGNISIGSGTSTAGSYSASGQITGGNITTAGQLTVNSGANVTAIVNGAASGVGNIGTLATAFNTVFAKATTAQYADLAEVYTADATYSPGTVVSFGGTHEITISSISHNTQVAGIVSTQPAYLMNSTLNGEHTAEVALTGRVPCKVTGTIHKGDRLVASELAGVAGPLDTAQYQPGCIIGKALEEWNSGEIGTIEVAVGRT